MECKIYECSGKNEKSYEEDLNRILDRRILDLIKIKGWSSLTPVQIEASRSIIEGRNTLIISPTGSGKTEAAMLPIFSMMLSDSDVRNSSGVYVLYITPMKALINDLYKRIKWWTDRLGFIVGRKHGDVPTVERIRRLKKVPHILIITPENLQVDLDWGIRFREFYEKLRWVVIDEIHELIGSKRGVQVAILLERLRRVVGRDFQRIMLSATVGDPEYVIRFFTGSSERECSIVQSRELKKIRIHISRVVSSGENSLDSIARTIKNLYKPVTLVFVNSRYMAERLHEALERAGIDRVFVHHSSISSKVKEDVEDLVKNGEANIVVSTRTLELGVDLGFIERVILFRSPGQVSSLIQRIGRSGHSLDRISEGVILVDRDIDLLEILSLVRLMSRGYVEKPRKFRKPKDLIARTILGMSLRSLVSAEEIYSTLKSTYVFRDLSYEDFMRVVDYLAENKLIERFPDDSIRVKRNFFNIWSFNKNKNCIKSFSEFFSYINDNDMYIVRADKEVIGALDEFYVYRILRAGDVIRLSGRLWKVLKIDDYNKIVEVSATESGEGFIPLWNGDTASRSISTARSFYEILGEGSEDLKALKDLMDAESLELSLESVRSFRRWFVNNKIPIPREDLIVVEDLGVEKIVLYPFGDKLAEILGYVVLNEAFKRAGRDVEIRITGYGFSLRAEGLDPIELIMDICRSGRISESIRSALMRSPRLRSKVREIQYSFGKISGAEDDSFIVDEALNQILSDFEDEISLSEFIENLCKERIKVFRVRSREPSPISRRILEIPPTRIWLKDLSYTISKAMKGMALTVSEISEITELPEDLVESKLKDMRKDSDTAVIYFRDVASNDIRWVLVEDLEEISRDPLFEESFKPLDPDELFEITYKEYHQNPSNTLILRAGDIESNGGLLERYIRSDEVYEVRVRPAHGNGGVSFYNVKKKALKYVVLNAISFLQRSSEI
ncbi:MAG: DEAD/DEAH box helicase [Sulfolobales archaeon]